MGLAGPKKRTKISNDPNNTKWSKKTDSFGHKILTSQGWKPGEYLGAKDANHAEHYTSANASHIRVLLKDDNLGLGAKIGNQNADTFGLSQFSGLLGRLNGKSEEVLKKEEDSRRDVELRLYQGRRYGTMNFISAGYLVGDKIEARQDWGGVDPGKKTKAVEKQDPTVISEESTKSSKKRKRDIGAAEDVSQPVKEKKKKQKKTKDTEPSTSLPTTDLDPELADAKSKSKETKEERRIRKAAKASAKLEKQKRKDEKKLAKVAKRAGASSTKKAESEPSSSEEDEEIVISQTTSVPTSAVTSGTSTPLGSNPRRAIRSRYIASKRMASMDPNALKEIFMIKGSA